MTSSNVWLTVPNFASLECVWSLTFIDLNSGGSFLSTFKKHSFPVYILYVFHKVYIYLVEIVDNVEVSEPANRSFQKSTK